MKVWIDQDLCTGDGLCEEIAPDVFTLLDDGLAYVKEGDKIYAAAKGNPQGAEGMASCLTRDGASSGFSPVTSQYSTPPRAYRSDHGPCAPCV